jgi:hypothetical protein
MGITAVNNFIRPKLNQPAEHLNWLLQFKDPELEAQFEEAWAEDYCKFSSPWWAGVFLLQIVILIHIATQSTPVTWTGYKNEVWAFSMFVFVVMFHYYSTRIKPRLVVARYSQWCWASSAIVSLAFLFQQLFLNDTHDAGAGGDRDYKMFLIGAHFIIEILALSFGLFGWLMKQFTVVYILTVASQWYIMIRQGITPFDDSVGEWAPSEASDDSVLDPYIA